MKNTAKNNLSALEICDIIKACKESGITEFSYKDLTLRFQPQRNEVVLAQGQGKDHDSVVSDLFKNTDEKVKTELMNEQALIDAEESQLLIDDAFAYEKLQVSKDLERNRILNEKTRPS